MDKIIRWFGNVAGLIRTIIFILMIVAGLIFGIKFLGWIGGVMGNISGQSYFKHDYETIYKTDIVSAKEPTKPSDISVKLWERLWKTEVKPYLIQPVKYPTIK